MDPSRTLVTFLFQTEPDVQSVQLVGSWDNFNVSYPLERDLRRGQGEWKGCYTFKDIIGSDQDMAKIRNGGLKMGATYYYYYELDGSTETFNTSMPSTTACPYLPGQEVNVLTVPTQRTSLQRSASLSSMRISDYMTMNPEAKFIPPHSTPDVQSVATSMHKRSAPGLRSMSSTQSFSASPTWRRLFSSSKTRDEERGRSCERQRRDRAISPNVFIYEDRSTSAASNRSTARSISPESLRRFLSDDDVPPRPGSNLSEPPALVIPDEIMEENEDDDDFAISAVSETYSFTTRLSPPPYQRLSSASVFSAPLTTANLSTLTLDTMRPASKQELVRSEDTHLPLQSETATGSSALVPSLSVTPLEDEMLTFYDESNNDEDEHLDESASANQGTAQTSFFGYKLPENEHETQTRVKSRPTFGTQIHTGLTVPIAESSYLISPVATGFGIDDFVSELGWIVDSIGNKPE